MLDSLVAQTDRDFEVIIVDQNPDDRIAEFVRYGEACGLIIRHLRLAQPGLSAARNLGIAHATGELVGFPDDDCWYETETVANFRAAFAEQPGIAGVVGSWVEQESVLGLSPATGALSYSEWRRFRGKGASSITLFFRRDVVARMQGFDERLGIGRWYGAGEETDLLIRVLAQGGIVNSRPAARVRHQIKNATASSLSEACRQARRRARGTGALYAKHRMGAWVVIRGISGFLLRSFRGLQLRHAAIGINTALGAVEGLIKWRTSESRPHAQ
jgi:glycosyltransferase involved in cell wall biosynthesis